MRRFLFLSCLWLAAACGSSEESSAEHDFTWAHFDGHECAACGMIVREQPAPRGQIIYTDGERMYFCSVADMITFMQAPSPHGSPQAIFVEVNDPQAGAPLAEDPAPGEWAAASSLHYVVDIERPHVMGRPVLAYETEAGAERVALQVQGHVIAWPELSGQ